MKYIDTLRDGPVTFIKINRPEAMNSITDEMHSDLNTAFDDFSSDKEQLSNELSKLNELLQSGVLTQEEFQKAKDKIFYTLPKILSYYQEKGYLFKAIS